MKLKEYFLLPNNSLQKQYEALRAFYVDGLSTHEITQKFGYSIEYFKKIRSRFVQQMLIEENPFFQTGKTGPKNRFTDQTVIEKIIVLRKQNHSIQDIRMFLESEGHIISLETIDDILKSEGFAPLPRRTRQEKLSAKVPKQICPPQSHSLIISQEIFSTERGAGPLIFLPLIEKLGIVPAIQNMHFPSTKNLTDVSSIMSLLALKILGKQRLSHDETWSLDRALGLFALFTVLPKSATLSSYTRVSK